MRGLQHRGQIRLHPYAVTAARFGTCEAGKVMAPRVTSSSMLGPASRRGRVGMSRCCRSETRAAPSIGERTTNALRYFSGAVSKVTAQPVPYCLTLHTGSVYLDAPPGAALDRPARCLSEAAAPALIDLGVLRPQSLRETHMIFEAHSYRRLPVLFWWDVRTRARQCSSTRNQPVGSLPRAGCA